MTRFTIDSPDDLPEPVDFGYAAERADLDNDVRPLCGVRFIHKPVTREELQNAITGMLQKRQAQ